jgi:Txe/YoeB family toxin of Txe-Axe toxin-antitoxin module
MRAIFLLFERCFSEGNRSILSNIYPKPQTADLGRRLQKEHFLTEKVEFLIDRFRHSAFFDVKKLEAVHRELLGANSRGRQHVLGFHLL